MRLIGGVGWGSRQNDRVITILGRGGNESVFRALDERVVSRSSPSVVAILDYGDLCRLLRNGFRRGRTIHSNARTGDRHVVRDRNPGVERDFLNVVREGDLAIGGALVVRVSTHRLGFVLVSREAGFVSGVERRDVRRASGEAGGEGGVVVREARFVSVMLSFVSVKRSGFRRR